MREYQILDGIVDGSIFGIAECDIEVPDHLRDKFKDFQPIFKHVSITINDVGEHMKAFCKEAGILKSPRNSLVGSYFANNHLIATDLLRWYIQEGFTIKRIHMIVQYHRQKVFSDFCKGVMDARRAADKDPSTKIVADVMKLIGNSAYGKTITDKEKFTNISFLMAKDVNKISQAINNKLFNHLDYIGETVAQIESHKRASYIDIPVLIGFMTLQRSKLILLRLLYYFLYKYLARKDYCLLECDTDSMYIALAGGNLFSLVKPNLRDDFENEYSDWFAIEYCPSHKSQFFEAMYRGERWDSSACSDCQDTAMYDAREIGMQLYWNLIFAFYSLNAFDLHNTDV